MIIFIYVIISQTVTTDLRFYELINKVINYVTDRSGAPTGHCDWLPGSR